MKDTGPLPWYAISNIKTQEMLIVLSQSGYIGLVEVFLRRTRVTGRDGPSSRWTSECEVRVLSNSGIGQQGWPSGESTRLPPVWPGFDSPSRCHM